MATVSTVIEKLLLVTCTTAVRLVKLINLSSVTKVTSGVARFWRTLLQSFSGGPLEPSPLGFKTK